MPRDTQLDAPGLSCTGRWSQDWGRKLLPEKNMSKCLLSGQIKFTLLRYIPNIIMF